MPQKSVREMNTFERKRYALAAKVFYASVMGSLILGLVALIAGVALYAKVSADRLINESFAISNNAAMLLESMGCEELEARADAIMDIYRGLSEEERQLFTKDPEAYRAFFEGIPEDDRETSTMDVLRFFLQNNEVFAVYCAMYDEETASIVYIYDPETDPEYQCLAGDWEPVVLQELKRFLAYDGSGILYDIGSTDKYGLMCTSGVPLRDENGEIYCFILTDVVAENLLQMLKSFLWKYTLLILAAALLVGYFVSRHMRKTLVEPVNEIADAAVQYASDRKHGRAFADRFASLDIRTGDEIENLSLVLSDMGRELAEYEDNLKKITAEKERISTELALAKRIQTEILPNIFPPFPDHRDIDLYASMSPAKEVGGDFYDFFFVDDDHLALVMADVSGKGIPAALFMMGAKILLQNLAMSGYRPAEVLKLANDQICGNNREEMFVTVWFGILTLSTGEVTAANAGHEYPVLKRPDGDFELLKDKHSFVVGGYAGIEYKEYTLRMEPGTKLFLYTDGVTEAEDNQERMFGMDRLLEALNRAKDEAPVQILKEVEKSVDDFACGASQFDDLTMLCVHYIGKTDTEEGTK